MSEPGLPCLSNSSHGQVKQDGYFRLSGCCCGPEIVAWTRSHPPAILVFFECYAGPATFQVPEWSLYSEVMFWTSYGIRVLTEQHLLAACHMKSISF